jgi:hypothetical protein
MLALPEAAVGAVIAASIAALISLLSLIISKEQKTSEFRQAWIDSLRSEVAAIVAHANALHGVSAAGLDTPSRLGEASRNDFLGINQATSNIRLRLNPREYESQSVLKSIEQLEAYLRPWRSPNYQEMDAIEKRLVADAQVLSKKEWVRVRKGERVFRTAKILAMLFVLAGTEFMVYSVVQPKMRALHFSEPVASTVQPFPSKAR